MAGLSALLKLGGMAGGATFAGVMAKPVIGGARRALRRKERVGEEIAQLERSWLQQKANQLRQRRVQRDMAENASRLAAIAPDVYNRILAGRMLPKGAAVFGGQPRTDLMEDLTGRMAQGDFRQPPDDDSDLLAELAG